MMKIFLIILSNEIAGVDCMWQEPQEQRRDELPPAVLARLLDGANRLQSKPTFWAVRSNEEKFAKQSKPPAVRVRGTRTDTAVPVPKKEPQRRDQLQRSLEHFKMADGKFQPLTQLVGTRAMWTQEEWLDLYPKQVLTSLGKAQFDALGQAGQSIWDYGYALGPPPADWSQPSFWPPLLPPRNDAVIAAARAAAIAPDVGEEDQPSQ